MILKAYTDGGCSNNGGYNKALPTVGKYGYVLINASENIIGEEVKVVKGNATNNRMELMGITCLLKTLNFLQYVGTITECEIFTDSKYCIQGFTNYEKWFKKKNLLNKDLWEEAIKTFLLVEDKIKFTWIKGHQNDNNWNDYIDLKLQKL